MRFTSIVYLDPALTSLAYEELRGVSPATKIARTTDLEAGLSGVFVRVGGSSKETREFAVSTVKMFEQIESELNALPMCSLVEAPNAKDLFWARGNLCIGRQSVRDHEDKTLNEVSYFMLADFAEKGEIAKAYLELVVHDSYFTSGYDRMAAFKETLGSHIYEPVRVLLRPIYANRNADIHLFAPFVILKHTLE